MLSITKPVSDRIQAVNVLCIFMVVGIHSRLGASGSADDALGNLGGDSFGYVFQEFLCNGLYMVAVPMLFLLSGVLFFRDFDASTKQYRKKLASRIRTLAIPYLIYSALSLLVKLSAQLFLNASGPLAPSLGPLPLFGQLLMSWIVSPVFVHLWFLRDLFLLVLLSPLIYRATRWLGLALVGVLALLWLFAIEPFPVVSHFHIIKIESIFFFSCGAWIASCCTSLDKGLGWMNREGVGMGAIGGWLSLNLVRSLIEPDFQIFNTHHFSPLGLMLHKLGIVVGIVAVIHLSQFLPRYSAQFLSRFSFFTYLFHMPLCWAVSKGVKFVLSYALPIQFLLSHLITFAVVVLAGYVMHRLLPGQYRVLTGAR